MVETIDRINSEVCLSQFYVYGLVHKSNRFFKIGWTNSIDARVHVLGRDLFNFGFGVAIGVNSIEQARIVEKAAHESIGEWSLSQDELEDIPRSGSTEWFSTKGLYDLLYWIWKSEQELKFKVLPFRTVVENTRNFCEVVDISLGALVDYGVEPKGRTHYLDRKLASARAYGPRANIKFDLSLCGKYFTVSSVTAEDSAVPTGSGFGFDVPNRRDAFVCMERFESLLRKWRLSPEPVERNCDTKVFSVEGWPSALAALSDLWVTGMKISRFNCQA